MSVCTRATSSALPTEEADPPARHPVGLRRRPQLARHLARAVDRQDAADRAVEGEAVVGEVVQQPAPALAREGDRGLERAGALARRARVGRVVEDRQRRPHAGDRVEVGLERGGRLERQRDGARPASATPDR
jgi:hypothetical protein